MTDDLARIAETCSRLADEIETELTHEAGRLAQLAFEVRRMKQAVERLNRKTESQLTTWKSYASLTSSTMKTPTTR